MFVRFNHGASVIVNANDCRVRAGVSLCVTDSASRVVIATGASEWQLIRNEIECVSVFRRPNFPDDLCARHLNNLSNIFSFRTGITDV